MQNESKQIIQILANAPEGLREEIIREVFTTISRKKRREATAAGVTESPIEMRRPWGGGRQAAGYRTSFRRPAGSRSWGR